MGLPTVEMRETSGTANLKSKIKISVLEKIEFETLRSQLIVLSVGMYDSAAGEKGMD